MSGDRQFMPWWRWVMAVLNILALGLSIYLTWHYFTGTDVYGCGGEGSCNRVLNSKWSTIAGFIPVSGLAVGVYITLLVASFFIGPDTEIQLQRLAWSTLLILSGSITGSAIWFIVLQKWIIGSFCTFCMIIHITGILLSALIIWRVILSVKTFLIQDSDDKQKNNPALKSNVANSVLHAAGLILAGLALSGMIAAGQIFLNTTPRTFNEGRSHENMSSFDYSNVPVIGSSNAPYVVLLMFDYQCPHCQRLHFLLDRLISRYNGKVAFAICPVPLNSQCNPYVPESADAFKNSCELARIGMAVWYADKEVFPEFENYMYTFESGNRWHPRSTEEAKAKAIELVGRSKFEAALSDPWIDKYINTCVQIYGYTLKDGIRGVPRLVYNSKWIIPEVYSENELVTVLQERLGIPCK